MSTSPEPSLAPMSTDADITTAPLYPAIEPRLPGVDVNALLATLTRAMDQKSQTIGAMKRLVQMLCASAGTPDNSTASGSVSQLPDAITALLADAKRDSQTMKDVVEHLQRTTFARMHFDIEDKATHQEQLPPTEGTSRLNVLFIGNPGTGKSTLINCLLGEVVFNAGVSYGSGLTNRFDECRRYGVYYMDTPGLADQVIEKTAAAAITTALRQGGKYKLFFFVRLQHGRVVSDDLVTIERVLDTIDSDAICSFSIIVNNVSPKTYDIMQQKGAEFLQVMTLINSGKYVTHHFIFNPQLPALVEQDNATAPLPDEMHSFVRDAPWMDLEPRQVEEIDTSDYRALAERLRSNLELLQRNNREKEHKLRELQKRFARRDRTVPHAASWRFASHDANHDVVMDSADAVIPFATPVQPPGVYDQHRGLQQQHAGYFHPSTTSQAQGIAMGTRNDFSE